MGVGAGVSVGAGVFVGMLGGAIGGIAEVVLLPEKRRIEKPHTPQATQATKTTATSMAWATRSVFNCASMAVILAAYLRSNLPRLGLYHKNDEGTLLVIKVALACIV